ncbi:AAA family ATPase [Tolypothrix sp. VBCCA 56010]|uniref:AAA family ATPase n=1 Tax=Tolypothrix sp. VBCCA 56010 TaxID=3137731 RepID=UPI003D7D330E
MINSLKLINYKAFENQLVEFKPLTLLSGLNSTGKSSVLQSLLLLRQSYQQELLPNVGLALNGELVRIGNAQDAFCERAKQDYLSFEIIWKDEKKGIWRFSYDQIKTDADVLNTLDTQSLSVDPGVYKLSLFNKRFHYLQAERLGPRTSYDMSDYQVRRLGQVGTKGEYTAHFLAINQDKDVLQSKLRHPMAKSNALSSQVEGWMREVSPGTRIKINSNSDIGLMSLQYLYGDSNPYRTTNVGFGISYTLPIIVAVLASSPGTLIIIENPEAHLHPKGQVKMGELLSLAASCGIQVVIETHSDHVLNGIRLAVHSGKIKPDDVQLHYFQRQEKQGQPITEVVSPHIDRNGRIDKWPDGFFDEWEKSLDVLLEPAGE